MTGRGQLKQTTDEKGGNGHDRQQGEGLKARRACPDYLGPWPVSLGENAQTYESLLSAVAIHYSPSDPIEWMYVRDVADCEWQKQRMRRAITICIDLAKVDAIEKVLNSTRNSHFLDPGDVGSRDLAVGYVEHSPRYRPFVVEFLKEAGLTEEAFSHAAVAVRAAEIDRLERSAMLHQACRDEAIANIQRHRASKMEAARPALPAHDAKFRVTDNGGAA